ncbi:MAG: uracil-DNA glycosylase family protein [Bacteroidaceae bacterium]|nr:uracil-DNA glycosylase family protein [Bacteroidaceae bacterium]
MEIPSEKHPLQPFLPANARLLMLGSFPPKRERWSMEFFYPNWINDMWRIVGLLFYDNKHHFEVMGEKRFDCEKIVAFCREKGIALYDTACEVRRLKDNASDKYLEVVTSTDVPALLRQLPQCSTIVTTGEKATDTLCALLHVPRPAVGAYSDGECEGRKVRLFRMPSSSRAYPMSIDQKSSVYRILFEYLGWL